MFHPESSQQCPECGHENAWARATCERCPHIFAIDAVAERSMPTSVTSQVSSFVLGCVLRVVLFATHARELIPLTPIQEVVLPKIDPTDLGVGGLTNLGAALDEVKGREGTRIWVSDGERTDGVYFSDFLARVKSEHELNIRHAVVGIREDGCSYNAELEAVAFPQSLYCMSAFDERLAPALVKLTLEVSRMSRVPELHILMDVSASMQEGSKWQAAMNALQAVVEALRKEANVPASARWLAPGQHLLPSRTQ